MATTVSEFVIGRLREWGVRRVFAFPGDGIGEFDGMLGKAERAGEGLEYIRPTHEEICAAADAGCGQAARSGVLSDSSPRKSGSRGGVLTRPEGDGRLLSAEALGPIKNPWVVHARRSACASGRPGAIRCSSMESRSRS